MYSADPKFLGNATRLVIPRLRIGERGIWVVRRSNSDVKYVHGYNYGRWPAREAGGRAGSPPFETAKAFAEAVGQASKLRSVDDVIAALQRSTTDANPYISSWAISRLPEVSQRSPDSDQFLHRLVENTEIPIQGQVELDKIELSVRAGWGHSDARLRLFRRWLAGAPSADDAHLVVSRLDHITQHPDAEGFPQEDLLALVTLLAKNEMFPLSERQRTGTIMSWAAKCYKGGDEKVFETAVELASSDVPAELRGAIAGVFVWREFTLDDERRAVLTKLRDAEKTASVAAILTMALSRPTANKP